MPRWAGLDGVGRLSDAMATRAAAAGNLKADYVDYSITPFTREGRIPLSATATRCGARSLFLVDSSSRASGRDAQRGSWHSPKLPSWCSPLQHKASCELHRAITRGSSVIGLTVNRAYPARVDCWASLTRVESHGRYKIET